MSLCCSKDSKPARSGGYSSLWQSGYGGNGGYGDYSADAPSPIDGNIYFWMAHNGVKKPQVRYTTAPDSYGRTSDGTDNGKASKAAASYGQGYARAATGPDSGAPYGGRTDYGQYEAVYKPAPPLKTKGRLLIGFFLLATLQLFGPMIIVYNQTIDWPFKFGFGFLFPDAESDKKLYMNLILTKLCAMICFYLFVDKVATALQQKAVAATKMAVLAKLQGDRSSCVCLANLIIPLCNILTVVATFVTLLEATDVISVVTNAAGLTLLVQLDEMGGIDLGPLGPDQWDPQVQGKNYADLVRQDYPGVDPDDLSQPFCDGERNNMLKCAANVLHLVQILLTAGFLCVQVTATAGA